MKILAIDFGLKRMGLAVGNTVLRSVNPIQPINRKKLADDLNAIQNFIEEYDIQKIVIGYPLNMDGSQSEMTANVEHFANFLKKHIDIDIEFVDERLTSFEAFEMLKPIQPDLKKRKKSKDSISAMVILNSYLEQR